MASTACSPTLAAVPVLARDSNASVSPLRAVNWRLIAQCLVLIAVTVACYWPALNGEFQWDDGVLIRDNELLRSLAGLRDIWFSTKPYDYFPLTYTSFWLEWPLWGNDPAGYHLVNLGLHLAAAGLLWRLLLELRLPGAWFAALLFALHPLNVASVAWIAERKNTLSMVFYLACLLCYVRFEHTTDALARRRRYGWALGFFVLAALSKSSVVMLPFVLLLLCWWRRGRISRVDLARSVPFFVVSLACGVATMWFQYHRAMSPSFHDEAKLPLLVRTLMAGHAAWFYLGKALLPVRLSMLYPHWNLGASTIGDFLPALGWLALLVATWLGRGRWGRGPFAALAYFVLTLAPVSGLFFMSYFQYSYVSDHLVHLSLISIIVGVAAVLGAWQQRGGAASLFAGVAMGLVAGACCIATPLRADQFSTSRRLWESTRALDPKCFAVYLNLGSDELAHRRLAEAEADFTEAVKLEPRSFSSCNHLANVLRLQGKWRHSAAVYEAILQIQPDAPCYNNLAVVFLEMGDTHRARLQLEHALALEPTMGSAYFNLFKVERAEHHLPAAAAALRGCLRCNPNDAVAMTELATLSLEQAPDPLAVPGHDSLVIEPAIALAERACQLTQDKDPLCLEVFSKVLRASGRSSEAIVPARKALAAAVRMHQTGLAQQYEAYAASLSGNL